MKVILMVVSLDRYVAPRWTAFSDFLMLDLEVGIKFDKETFKSYVFETVEKPFADDENTSFPATTQGNYIAMPYDLFASCRVIPCHLIYHRSQNFIILLEKEIQKLVILVLYWESISRLIVHQLTILCSQRI